MDKENAESRKGIFVIDASKGFIKDGNKNRLRDQDIHKIVDVFKKQLEIPKYSRMVTIKEIAEDNEYNLNIQRYIDSSEEEDLQDISSHLLGGIPNRDVDKLKGYWEVYPTLKKVLYSEGNRENYSKLNISMENIIPKLLLKIVNYYLLGLAAEEHLLDHIYGMEKQDC